MRAITATVLIASLVGCSFSMHRLPDPPPSPGEPVYCDDSRARPIFDALVATAAGLAAGYLALIGAIDDCLSCGSNEHDDEFFLAAGITAIGAATYTASSIYGFHHRNRCLAAKGDGVDAGD